MEHCKDRCPDVAGTNSLNVPAAPELVDLCNFLKMCWGNQILSYIFLMYKFLVLKFDLFAITYFLKRWDFDIQTIAFSFVCIIQNNFFGVGFGCFYGKCVLVSERDPSGGIACLCGEARRILG